MGIARLYLGQVVSFEVFREETGTVLSIGYYRIPGREGTSPVVELVSDVTGETLLVPYERITRRHQEDRWH